MKRSIAAVPAALAGFVTAAALAADPPIPLGPDTTFWKSPLKANGTVDYVAGVDALARKGVTPETNAFVPLLKAAGTDEKVITPALRDETLRRLGMGQEQGKLFYRLGKSDVVLEAAAEDVYQAAKAPWRKEAHRAAAEWIETDREALDLFAEASKLPKYYRPSVSVNGLAMGVMLPSLGTVRSMANLTTARAMLRLEAGDVDGCTADLLAVHRVGRLVGNGGTLIEMLVGCALENLASTADAALAHSGKLSARQAADYLAALDTAPAAAQAFEVIHVSERICALDAATRAGDRGLADVIRATAGPNPSVTVGPDAAEKLHVPAGVDLAAVLRDINAFYDTTVRAARQPDARKRAAMFAEQKRTLETIKRDSTLAIANLKAGRQEDLTKAYTNILLAIFLPDLERAVTLQEKSRQMHDLGRVAIALAAYKADKGSYPDALAALTPDYLKTLPTDRFSGGPLTYKRAGDGYVLYGVGENLTDDGGKQQQTGKREGDIVVRAGR